MLKRIAKLKVTILHMKRDWNNWAVSFIFSYSPTTGLFTVPPGSAGLYYFSVFVQIDYDTKAVFKLRLNHATHCRARGDTDDGDHNDSGITLEPRKPIWNLGITGKKLGLWDFILFEIRILEIMLKIGILGYSINQLLYLKLGLLDCTQFEIGIMGLHSIWNWDYGITDFRLTGPYHYSISQI